MKILLTCLVTTSLASPLFAEEACCAAPAAPVVPASAPAAAPAGPGIDVGGCYGTPAPAAIVGHPLRGVIIDILPDKSALLVAHEEIPGVMRAMTMLLKVDATTLASAKKNAAITATLLKKSDGWWLENVAQAPKAKID